MGDSWLTPQKKITLLCQRGFSVVAQYGEIKANTVDVYFGLISEYVSASRTKRENRAQRTEKSPIKSSSWKKKQ